MTRYRITYWKDIPQSFTVEGDGQTVKKQLSQKVQNAIDAAAMAAGLTSASDYAREYRRGEWIERAGSPAEVAEALLAELEAEFTKMQVARRNGKSTT